MDVHSQSSLAAAKSYSGPQIPNMPYIQPSSEEEALMQMQTEEEQRLLKEQNDSIVLD